MKTPAILVEETRWHENGQIVNRPAGTECFRLDGDLKQYEPNKGVAYHVADRCKREGRIPILLDEKLRHVEQGQVK